MERMKTEQEITVIEKMIELYCHGQRHTKEGMCEKCLELFTYAKGQINHCPHKKDKTFCSCCPTHCYKPDKREQVRSVMRYAGPRLLLYHPILTLRHGVEQWKKK